MKKLLALTLFLPFLFFLNVEEKLSTQKGTVSFVSMAADHPNIKAVSHAGNCTIDKKNGAIDFTVIINDFRFDDEGMQELFSKQVMESERYPTAGFKGIIIDLKTVDFTKDGDYRVHVKGSLTLHGITKDLQTQCSLKVTGKNVRAMAEFKVNMKDFKIGNPIDNDNVRIMIDCLLETVDIVQ